MSWKAFRKRRLIISPDSIGKLVWDLICMILIFYDLMSIPFRISFNVTFSETFDTLITIAFFSDMFISFNTAFYREGDLVYERKEIAIQYLKIWFWLDLAATFPYDIVIEATLENIGSSGSLLK